MPIQTFYKLVCEKGYYSNPERLMFYLEKQLFKGQDFKNKTFLDIGGGNGLFGFYAALKGAKKVVIMEPEFDGSSVGMINQFYEIKSLLGNPENIEHTTNVLEQFSTSKNRFDYILMHNSINHLDEAACIRLKTDDNAQEVYLEKFKILKDLSCSGTHLIICDCGRRNFFGDLGITNPLAKTIDWSIHQSPLFWSELFCKVGFKTIDLNWTTLNTLGSLGSLFFNNRIAAYFTLSHFRLMLINTN